MRRRLLRGQRKLYALQILLAHRLSGRQVVLHSNGHVSQFFSNRSLREPHQKPRTRVENKPQAKKRALLVKGDQLRGAEGRFGVDRNAKRLELIRAVCRRETVRGTYTPASTGGLFVEPARCSIGWSGTTPSSASTIRLIGDASHKEEQYPYLPSQQIGVITRLGSPVVN